MKITALFAACAALGLSTMACRGAPASPFDRLHDSQITVYRLQNYEPASAPAATTGTPSVPTIPGLPPEIQTWVTQGASGLGALFPAGVIPPGMIPGQPATTTTTPAADTARFEGFRIIGQAQVVDSKLRDALIGVFGYPDSFNSNHGSCLYAEMGVSFAQTSAPPDDVLVSFSCNQAQPRNFNWPHPQNGLTNDSHTKLANVMQQLFGGN